MANEISDNNQPEDGVVSEARAARNSNRKYLYGAVAAFAVASVVAALSFSGIAPAAKTSPAASASAPAAQARNTAASQTIGAGESLTIPVADQSNQARFYPVVVDGVNMEVLTIKDSAGAVRTAFNTCQVCYTSGKGYYVQKGNDLVCQNCGNRFTADQVGGESRGCNPWPIAPTEKTVSADTIFIPYDSLKKTSAVFANWKAA